ncbi:phosphatase PAP2 family protein [Kutzneria kofuensis]|uniref:Membrane-associated phospholipid phosphatase n=1 Tax=Kutzneria kofuensis TaxID=103725 RepID=A0A7W9KEV6_9PSEU|nr:phosphatase PAP2 family protein [Kutzneria kofuensis]MBB5891301.1 membrane-associated phospholipid phosphatase [Kutzneria kofuensis]
MLRSEESSAQQTQDVPARRWLHVAIGSAIVTVAVYVLAVLTPVGQSLENAALRGADQVGASEAGNANASLDQITVYSLAAAVVVIAAIGLLRRRWDLALASVGVIVAGQIVTQGLKRYVLPRPSLVPLTGHYADNSLPSGHTTVAMTVLFAALIVVPYRWRGVALFFVLSWAVGIGSYTVTAKWHRLSDTLAADAIALALACLASWWLARRGLVRHHDGKRRIPRVLIVTFTAVGGAVLLALGVFFLVVPLAQNGLDSVLRDDTWIVYIAAQTLASAGSIIAALVFLGTWRRLEIG